MMYNIFIKQNTTNNIGGDMIKKVHDKLKGYYIFLLIFIRFYTNFVYSIKSEL